MIQQRNYCRTRSFLVENYSAVHDTRNGPNVIADFFKLGRLCSAIYLREFGHTSFDDAVVLCMIGA